MSYTVSKISPNVCIVEIKYRDTFRQSFLLTADRHWDNTQSDWGLQLKHLKQAKERKAGVIDVGDFFCAMQGKYDKRSSKSTLRPEHQRTDYLDALSDTASVFFDDFVEDFIVIAEGNHETAIKNKHEVSLINNLVRKMKERHRKAVVYNGGYSGWVIFKFVNTKTGQIDYRKLWYIHGYGGGGPVTKGIIQTNRKAVYLPDADFVVTGHIHEEWQFPVPRIRVSNEGLIEHDEQLHIQIPTYKDEYGSGYGGWHVETGKPPKPIGAIWLNFYREDKSEKKINVDATRAK